MTRTRRGTGFSTTGRPADGSLILPRLEDLEPRLLLNAQTTADVALVAGRHVFYNRSAWDGNDPAANVADDAAIATNKQALLPGGTSTGANLTSYSRGINGVMIDIASLADPGGLTLATVGNYFTFTVGNDSNPGAWASAPMPAEILVRPGAGSGGSDRVTIIWADNDIQNKWLQVTVLANANTGLAASDVFYFGNLRGDTNNDGDVDFADYQVLEAGFGESGSISQGDFNVDGLVQFDDYQVLEGSFGGGLPMLNLSLLQTGGFVRDSAAYDENGAELAADEAEWADVAVANPPDPISLAGAGPNGENLTPWCVGESGGTRYMYYSRVTTNSMPSYIFRQAEGSGTIVRMNKTLFNIYGIIGLASGTILILSNQYVYRSTDGGATADRGDGRFIAANAALTLLTGQVAVPWGHHQAPDTGTVLMWPYGGSSSDSYQLYRSADDGATWTLVYTITDDIPFGNRHYHSAVKHAATGRWIVTRGDGANDRILYSDDDGLTWGNLVPRGLWRFRPIGMWDYGDPTRILIGSDSNGQVQWFDVLSLERGNLLTDLDRRAVGGDNGKRIVLDLYEQDGIYYAPTSDDSGSDQNCTLRVSSDMVHWTSYYRFTPGTARHYVAGYFNGRIYLRSTSGSWNSWTGVTVAPPTLATRQAMRISQGVTNLLANANDSSFEASVGSWGKPAASSTYSVTWSTERAWHGTGSMKVTWGPGVSPIGVRTVHYPSGGGYYPVSEGERYTATLRVRGTLKRYITAYWGFNTYPTQVTTNAPYVEVDDLGWTVIRLAEVTVGPGQTGMKIILSGDGDSGQVLYVDGCQLERLDAGPRAPAIWQLGGTARAAPSVSWQTNLSSEWTVLGTFVPEYDRWQFDTIGSGNYLHLASVVVGNTAVELFSDPGNADKFNIIVTDGVTSETERTTAQYFHRGGPIHWAIRSDSGGHLSLSVANGAAVEHTSVTSNAFTGLLNADGYIYAGDSEGDHLLPGWMANLRVFAFRMTDAEIAEQMNNVKDSQTLVRTTMNPATLQAAVSPQPSSQGQGTDLQRGLAPMEAKAARPVIAGALTQSRLLSGRSVSGPGSVAPPKPISPAAPSGAVLEAMRPLPLAGADLDPLELAAHRPRQEPSECLLGDFRQPVNARRGNHWRWLEKTGQDALTDDGLLVDLLSALGRQRWAT